MYADRTFPLQVRMPALMDYTVATNRIVKMYLGPFGSNAVGDDEMVELMGKLLRVSAAVMALVNEFTPTLDKNDPKYAVRLQGLAEMKAGLATVLLGALMTVDEPQYYRKETRRRLLGYMKATFPLILPGLTEESRKEILLRLKNISTKPELAELREQLEELQASITASTESLP